MPQHQASAATVLGPLCGSSALRKKGPRRAGPCAPPRGGGGPPPPQRGERGGGPRGNPPPGGGAGAPALQNGGIVGEYRATALLVVGDEDHPDTLVRQVREAGVDAVTADADGALARLGCREIDVLVASILVCPSPAELVEEALRREPGIEIVIASARDAFEQALFFLRSCASDAISSPIEGDGLLTAINRALDRCRARGLARELLEAARSAGLGQLTGSIAHEIANSLAILNS